MDKDAQNCLKLEVIVKTDDGKVICHQTVGENESKSKHVRQENNDQNSFHSMSNSSNGDMPKVKSYFSKFLNCWDSKSSASDETSDDRSTLSQHETASDLKKTHSNASPSMSHSAYSESKSTETKVPGQRMTANEPPQENFDVEPTNLQSAPTKVVTDNQLIKEKVEENSSVNGHWPLFDKRLSESLCKMKNCYNRTRVYCEKCGLHFCFNTLRNCFYKFHKQNHHVIVDKSKQLSQIPKPSQNNLAPDKQDSVIPKRKNPILTNNHELATPGYRKKYHHHHATTSKRASNIIPKGSFGTVLKRNEMG